MLSLGSIIAFLLSNIEIAFVIIVVVGGVLNTISKAGKTLSDQQRRVMQDTELQRRRLLEEQARLEANPNTQSYSGYLDRSRPEKLEDLYHEKEDSLFTDLLARTFLRVQALVNNNSKISKPTFWQPWA